VCDGAGVACARMRVGTSLDFCESVVEDPTLLLGWQCGTMRVGVEMQGCGRVEYGMHFLG
jgi:hypothetical protein